jgi:hypothetical protein
MGADQEVDRIARATRNQALLREVNERLNDIAQSFQPDDEHSSVCMRVR